MIVTIKDIAEKVGVSYATVSRALNDKYGVNAATKQQILEAATLLNYSPNAIARGLVKKQTHTIGLIIPDITNPFFPEVARGVEDYLEKKDYSVFLCNSNWEKSKENRYVKLLIEKRVDGLIVAPAASAVSEADRIIYSKLPVVLMSGAQPDSGTTSVVVNNSKGGYIVGRYFYNIGRKKLCFIGGSEDSFSVGERFEGFSAAAKECGIAISNNMINFGDYRQKSGYLIMKNLIDKKNIPDAVFASNDLLALGALDAILEAGLKVPKDIAVIGFDNIVSAGFHGIELTTVEHPKYKMGEIAAEKLLEIIESGEIKKSNFKRIVLEPELIVRKTA